MSRFLRRRSRSRAAVLTAGCALFGVVALAAGAGSAAAATVQPGTFSGEGFDACSAPSQETMDAWLDSPYRAIGVYIGGVSRACSQPNLTATWVSTQVSKGWHLIPTYVGLQAPCTSFKHRMSSDPATARQQGRDAGSDAVTQASDLGLAANSVLVYDIEAFDSTDSTCRTAVLNFLTGWTEQVHALHYLSSVYSSVSSGIKILVDTYYSTSFARPDQIWFARWDGVSTTSDQAIPNAYWDDNNRQRIKQYRGDHDETWGGKTINIDNDRLNVAAPANRNFTAYPTLRNGDSGSLVKAAQYLLNEDGRSSGPVDGTFGSKTEAAVKAFQEARGLTVDGVIGPGTWTSLLSVGWRPTLKLGSTGHEVRRLQRALTAALGREVTIDGDFGSQTEQAVKDYQSSRGLTVDGIVGNQTWGALQAGK